MSQLRSQRTVNTATKSNLTHKWAEVLANQQVAQNLESLVLFILGVL